MKEVLGPRPLGVQGEESEKTSSFGFFYEERRAEGTRLFVRVNIGIFICQRTTDDGVSIWKWKKKKKKQSLYYIPTEGQERERKRGSGLLHFLRYVARVAKGADESAGG